MSGNYRRGSAGYFGDNGRFGANGRSGDSAGGQDHFANCMGTALRRIGDTFEAISGIFDANITLEVSAAKGIVGVMVETNGYIMLLSNGLRTENQSQAQDLLRLTHLWREINELVCSVNEFELTNEQCESMAIVYRLLADRARTGLAEKGLEAVSTAIKALELKAEVRDILLRLHTRPVADVSGEQNPEPVILEEVNALTGFTIGFNTQLQKLQGYTRSS